MNRPAAKGFNDTRKFRFHAFWYVQLESALPEVGVKRIENSGLSGTAMTSMRLGNKTDEGEKRVRFCTRNIPPIWPPDSGDIDEIVHHWPGPGPCLPGMRRISAPSRADPLEKCNPSTRQGPMQEAPNGRDRFKQEGTAAERREREKQEEAP